HADFTVDHTIAYVGSTLHFSDASNNATSWSWSFGGSIFSSSQNPSISYSSPGLYSVTLTINAGVSSATKTNYIQVLPNEVPPFIAIDGGDFESNSNDFDA